MAGPERQKQPAAVNLNNVSKKYAGSLTVKGVSLEVPTGELVAITGHSGSGKSTLLRMMQGIVRPDEGKVTVLSHDIFSLSSSEKQSFVSDHLGIGFQAAALKGNFSVAENVAVTGRNAVISNQDIALLASYFGLGNKLFERASKLSGGEQMRVALMRALATNPELVLLDEPTGPLDTKNSRHTFQGLRNMVEENNTTVVMVSHDADVARPFMDREFVIEGGELRQTWTYDH